MFFGSFEHSLDGKNRLRIPASFKEGLGENPNIAIGRDGGLVIYPASTIRAISMSIREKGVPKEKRPAIRAFLANMFQLSEDSQGRFIISSKLRVVAGINKEVVFVGVDDRVELWSLDRWTSIDLEDSDIDLSDYGI